MHNSEQQYNTIQYKEIFLEVEWTSPSKNRHYNENFIFKYFFVLGARFYNQLDAAYITQDALEVELAKEIESSR